MIKIQRAEKPEILVQNADTWKAEYLEARMILSNAVSEEEKKKAKKDKEEKEEKYRHPEIKTALMAMHNDGKCAYCESHITHVSYPHIEHFRPKNKFPELCFEWENLLLGCGVCNGKGFKGIEFPATIDGGFLVNPCDEDPELFFDFLCEKDKNSNEGFIAVVRPKNSRGEITVQTLGLNRIPLLRKRTQTILLYLYFASRAKLGDQEAKLLLKKVSQPNYEYSAFAKVLLKQI